jgi:hypothetical protein
VNETSYDLKFINDGLNLNILFNPFGSGNQKPSSGENLMEFDRDFDFFRQFEVW